jgi:hypothetical protein
VSDVFKVSDDGLVAALYLPAADRGTKAPRMLAFLNAHL